MLVYRQFGGYANEQVLAKERKDLVEAIKKNGETGVNFDRFYIVGYDPPFKLFGRRNEIWLLKTKDKEEEIAKLIEQVMDTEIKGESNNSVSQNGTSEVQKNKGEGEE